MMKRYALLIAVVMFLGLTVSAHADLIDRGGGLIYDTDQNITWLQNANHAGVAMTFDNAVSWANCLSYYDSVRDVYWDDWRLPYITGHTMPYYGNDSHEMGHMYYNELGNTATAPPTNFGPFINNVNGSFWLYTPDTSPYSKTRYFSWMQGGITDDANPYPLYMYAWAVRDGDVAAVPEPSTLLLLGSGLVGLGFARRRLKRQ